MKCIIRHSLIDNNVFSNIQFGFIKSKSTILQLLEVIDRWTESLESGGQIAVIYTDLEKAFDEEPHKSWLANYILIKSNQRLSSGLN